MGVLTHRLLDCSLVPQSTRAEIFRRMRLQSHLKTPPSTPLKSYLKFWNTWATFQKKTFPGRGGPQNFWGFVILIFCYLEPMQNYKIL